MENGDADAYFDEDDRHCMAEAETLIEAECQDEPEQDWVEVKKEREDSPQPEPSMQPPIRLQPKGCGRNQKPCQNRRRL